MTLKTQLDHVWLADGRLIPTDKRPVPEAWNFASAQQLMPLDLDHCFAGFDGRAEIAWPERGDGLVIEAEPLFGHLVVFVPPGKPYVCVEPVSHVNDGFNLMAKGESETGVRVLSPGETLQGRVRFRPV
jgi:aldose 1-epimerase